MIFFIENEQQWNKSGIAVKNKCCNLSEENLTGKVSGIISSKDMETAIFSVIFKPANQSTTLVM